MANKIGTCALCKTKSIELKQSHLIPKLVWKRIKSNPKSSFRDLDNPNKQYQDGEKKYLLCESCESIFCKYEDLFAREFFLDFFQYGILKKVLFKENWMIDYCLSVSWRILYDDLYNHSSFTGQSIRHIFLEFENQLANYFNKQGERPSSRNYFYNINEIVKKENIIKLCYSSPFAYCIHNMEYNIFLILTCYANLIIVTEIDICCIDMNSTILKILKKRFFKRKIIKKILKEEISYEADLIYKKKQNVDNKVIERIKKKHSKFKD
ncbi:MAG: hypothetical protein AB1Z23_09510 [Eubacteriales bacterium]